MSSSKLAIPLSGVGRLTRTAANLPETGQEGNTLAAWQGESKGEYNPSTINPTRVVVRCDGNIAKVQDYQDAIGFPCAVLRVDYTIGGYARSVLVDAVNQSGLVVWCKSLEVTPVWDTRRIERLTTGTLATDMGEVFPCMQQVLAAAASACCNDTGEADARYLDVLNIDGTSEGGGDPPSTFEWSFHPVPNGARSVRFLNVTEAGAPIGVADAATLIVFITGTPAAYLASGAGFLSSVNNGLTDTSQIIVPVDATHMLVSFPTGTLAGYDSRTWLEWHLAPSNRIAF